jgi:hypothetical protein
LWEHYVIDLHMKYVFFINDKMEIAQISFKRFLAISKEYGREVKPKHKLRDKRTVGERLLAGKLRFTGADGHANAPVAGQERGDMC